MSKLLSPETSAALLAIRALSPAAVLDTFSREIPHNLQPSSSFISSLTTAETTLALRLCLLLFRVTDGQRCPREFQLRSALASLTRRDCLVTAGTGSGKTLCMILPLLLDPSGITITVSPLKRLQVTQVAEFQRYGIETVSINEDTPNDKDLWKRIRNGCIPHLLVQPEQLSKFRGHLPRLAQLLDERDFIKQIRCINVDEAHFIYTAGTANYGLDAFRPAWGLLGKFRVRLPRDTPFLAMSGTLPPHIKTCVTENLILRDDFLDITKPPVVEASP
ncbi:ATP-dependent DNA helicase sgs1 [Pleurotus pulmonarius]|nr:ATP-dependent DNA helicase sgs1 [Pleurotus pulmonarius]